MFLILLKSSICLLAFLLFYTFILEKENMHVFKRGYLLVAVVVAITIPFITFTHYINLPDTIIDTPIFQENLDLLIPKTQENTNYLPYILWSLYGIITLFFALRFAKNIFLIWKNIKNNRHQKTQNSILILVEKPILPQTFFNYIFLNKSAFLSNQIPETVLQHETTHAIQKHSIDVLFVEILIVIFWFNPLLYFLKNAIKLNHEFLANQAVLQNGHQTQQYQKTLLAYSSNTPYNQLANAINYSSIKKRLTIMKTQTTPKTKWIKIILIAPLFALLLFSFSTTKEVQITQNNTPILTISKKPTTYTLNGKTTTLVHLKEDFIKITKGKNSNLKINTTGEILFKHISIIRNHLTPYLDKILISDGVIIDKTDYSSISINKQKATPAQITEYNALAKKYNAIPGNNLAIKLKDIQRLRYLYGLMTKKQKASAVSFPNFPPAPPKPKNPPSAQLAPNNNKKIASIDGMIGCNNCLMELTKERFKNIKITAGGINAISFKIKFPGKPTLTIKNHLLNTKAFLYLKQSHVGDKIIIFKIKTSAEESIPPMTLKIKSPKVLKGEKSNTPKLASSNKNGHITINGEDHYYRTKNGTTKYYTKYGEEVTSKGVPVLPSTPPKPQLISSFNGVKCNGNVLKFSLEEIQKAIVSVGKHQVKSFNIKFTGKPTVRVDGNILNTLAKEYLKENHHDKIIQIFNIKIEGNLLTSPIIFKVKK